MAYKYNRTFHSNDVDTDRIVDNSYGFLSEMHGGDTLPRRTNGHTPPVQVVSWNERDSLYSSPRESAKVRYWEPRLKSVRDIPPEQLPPPRRPRQRFDEEPAAAQRRVYGQPEPHYLRQRQPSRDNFPDRPISVNGPKSSSPKGQFVSPPKAPEHWEKPSSRESNLPLYSNNTARRAEISPTRRDEPVIRKNDAANTSEKEKGSSLLQRTNHYLDAVGRMKSSTSKEDSSQPKLIQDKIKSHTSFVPTAPPLPKDVEVPSKNENRKSISERINDLNKNLAPAPPPMPPSVPQPLEHQGKPSLPYVSQIQTGRQTLRPIKKIMSGPEQTNLVEPQTFKERLNRLLKLQMDSRNKMENSIPEEHLGNEAGPGKYNTVKTLSKAAMKDKLEVILQVPPKNPSFRGPNDLADRREMINRYKGVERRSTNDENRLSRQSSRSSYLQRQPSNAAEFADEEVCHECGNRRRRHNALEDQQKALMYNVCETIRLKGRINQDSNS